MGKAKLAYRLELPSNLRIHPVFHVSALKAYFPENHTPPPLPSLIDGHVKYEVVCITNTRNEGKDREYLVHWAGYNESTWENFQKPHKLPGEGVKVLDSQRHAVSSAGALPRHKTETDRVVTGSIRDEQTLPPGSYVMNISAKRSMT